MADIEVCPECGIITFYIITDYDDTETQGMLCPDCAKQQQNSDSDSGSDSDSQD